MYYNINYEIATIIMLIILIIARRDYFKNNKKIIKQFMTVIIMVVITCCINITAALCYSNIIPVSDQVMLLVETVYLIMAMFCCYLQLMVVVSRCKYDSLLIRLLNFVLLAAVSVTLLINLSGKFAFEYQNHQFVGYTFFTAMYFIYVVFFIEMGVLLITNRRRLRKQVLLLTVGVLVCPILCILIQFVNDRLLLSELGAAIAFIIFNFSLEDEDYERWQNTLLELEESKEKEKQNRKDAQIAGRVKTIFMHNISNEFRSPIEDVLNISEKMLNDSKDEGIKNYTEKINESGQQLLSFVDELIEVAGENR